MTTKPRLNKWITGAILIGALLSISLLLLVLWGYAQIPPRVIGAYLDNNGVRIHYTDEGSGPPVLLLHGLAVNADYQWRGRGFIDRLKQDYRVITMDLRGHGLSDKPHSPDAYGLHMIEDALALLDHLHIDRVHLAGYSLGGFMTLKLLSTHPDRLLSAIICGAGWEQPTPENLRFGESVAEALENGQGFGPLLERLGVPEKETTWRREIKKQVILRILNDHRALAAVVRGMREFAVPQEALIENTLPALALIGDRDGLLPRAKGLAETMPNTTLITIAGGNHLNTSGKEAFREAFIAFLKAQQPTPVATI